MGVGSRSFSGRPALSLALALFFLGAPLFGLGFLGTSPNSGPARHGASHRGTSRIQRAAVEWLEPLDPNLKELDASGDEDSLVLPVFPLGGPFMPYSNPRLNIFEPRAADAQVCTTPDWACFRGPRLAKKLHNYSPTSYRHYVQPPSFWGCRGLAILRVVSFHGLLLTSRSGPPNNRWEGKVRSLTFTFRSVAHLCHQKKE